MNKLLIVDGNSLSNRAFYALPFLSNHEGNPSGAVFGFANILIKLIQQENPSYIFVAFDHARKTFRNEIYSEYKMQRKATPPELISQFPIIKEMLKTMNIKTFELEGIEADDIIGTVTKSFKGEKIILTGDRDLLQLIDDNTTVWLTKKGVSEIDKVDEKRLFELFNLKPYQIIELKGLMGDSSDNIPGVKGVGEKTALNLLEKYNNIDEIYRNIEDIGGKLKEKLLLDKEMAYISKKLATIKRDCKIDFNIEDCRYDFPFNEKTYQFFKQWDFSTLLKNQKLFSQEQIIKSNEKIDRIELTKDILQNIKKSNIKTLCYDLKNLQFLVNDKIYYLNNNFDMFSTNMTIMEVCQELKSLFENNNILKITMSAKDDKHKLIKLGIKLENYFDLSVANYVLEAGNKLNLDIPIQEYENNMNYYKKKIEENGLEFIYKNIEMPLIEILFKMEELGFKINEDKLNDISEEFKEKINKITKDIYFEAGEEFNINSPKQVANILFEKLGIQAYNNKKQSTSADVLSELRYIPIVDNILMYRKYTKLMNTYIDVYKNICSNSGSVIHTTFNQTLTSTGRLSSSEPNLQNIPTRDDEGKNLRKIFISKFENGKIISADYSQIELRLLADMSGEERLIEAFKNGVDIHKITASEIFGVDIDKVTQNQRREAKAINFGIIYGISDYGLSQNIKSSRKIAKEYINSYFNRYPKVKEFMDNNVKFAKEHGYAKTKFGRIRKIQEISSSNYNTRSFGERVAMNMPLQGTASDIIKLAMIKVSNTLKDENFKSQLILQIHDELIIDTYPGEEDKILNLVKDNMENVVKLQVPLIASVNIGKNLYECK